jgi:hypothetical protein
MLKMFFRRPLKSITSCCSDNEQKQINYCKFLQPNLRVRWKMYG